MPPPVSITVTGTRGTSSAVAAARYLALRTSGTPTITGSACTIDSTDLVLAPASLLSTTTGWVAACVKPSWASTAPPTNPRIFELGGITCYFYGPGPWWVLDSNNTNEARVALSHAAGDTFVIVATWNTTTMKLTKGTATFVTQTRTAANIVPLSAFSIGNSPAGDRPFTGDFYWLAAGNTLLTQTESNTLAGFGSTDPTSLPSSAVLFWNASSFVVPRVAVTDGGTGQLAAAVGPLTTSSGLTVPGDRGDVSASGQAGLTGMFTGWAGPGVNAPFVVGVTAQATATARPGAVAINNVTTQNAIVVGAQAGATATGRVGVVSTSAIGAATLVVEVDFDGNATAPYFDQVSQRTGTEAYWRFDDDAILRDEVGTNQGVVTGSPSLVTGALAYDTDQQLRFDGSTQYAQVPSAPVLTPAASYCASGWLRFQALPSASKVIFTKGSYRLLTTAANKLAFTVTNDQSGALTNTTVTTNTILSANTEYHVVCVHDADDDELRVYVNGVLDNTTAHTAGTELYAYPLTFAGRPYGTTPAFRSVGTAFNPAGSNQSLFVIPAPTYVQGDLLLAHIAQSNTSGTATLTAPSGWNLLSSLQGLGGAPYGHHSWMFWKYAGATEPGSYTWTSSVTTGWGGAVSSFGTVDPVNPFAKPVYTFVDSNSTGSHLIDADNTLVLALGDCDSFSGPNLFTWSSGTERYDVVGPNVPAFAVGMSSQVPSAETTLNVTNTVSSSRRITSMVALAGTGIGTYTAVDLDEWSFSTTAPTDSDVAEMYEARLSGVAAWTDVSADVRKDGANLSYGRQYELNRMESGHANITLKNIHRYYDPANTSSIYYPNVKPNRKIRMRALLNGNYYPLWEGLIERWPSDWGISWNYDEVSLTIADGFKALNRAGVSALTGAAISGTQLDTFLSRALWPVDKRVIDAGEFIMSAETTDSVVGALAIIQDIADSELGQFFVDHVVDGSPATFHDRGHRWSNTRSLTSQVTFSDPAGTGINYIDLVPSDDDDNVTNEWIVTSANGTTGTAVDATSRQQNYPVTGERSTRLDNPDDAIVQARALLQQTARPALRFDQLTVRLTRQTAAAVWQAMLELAISDRVTVVRNPVPAAGGSSISKDCFIEGISWSINRDFWDVSFQLSPISSLPFYDSAIILDPVSYWRMDEIT